MEAQGSSREQRVEMKRGALCWAQGADLAGLVFVSWFHVGLLCNLACHLAAWLCLWRPGLDAKSASLMRKFFGAKC